MIPVSSKEFIEYKDSDGNTWKFKPKTGALEREMVALFNEEKDLIKRFDAFDAFVDKILITPKYDYNSDEKAIIISYWYNVNKLTPEEKKS